MSRKRAVPSRHDTAGPSRRLRHQDDDTSRLLRFAQLVRRHSVYGPVVRDTDVEAPATPLERAIETSRWILDLRAGWDDEGALPCAQAWHRATDYLRRQAQWVFERLGVVLDAPDLMPLADGSVDIHWDLDPCELLINVPSDASRPASFYGDDRGSLNIKGTLATESFNEGLLQWLAARQPRSGRESTSPILTGSSSVSTAHS